MGTLFKIAWRNVWRHGKRTALTIITMTIGLGLYIGIDSLLRGMDRGGLESIVDLSDSSVRVSTKAYEAERRSAPLDYGIPDLPGLEAQLLKDGRVLALTPRTRFVGSLSTGQDSIPVMVTAVDPRGDPKVFKLKDYLEGAWFDEAGEGLGAGGLILGAKLAADLGVGPGDWLTLSARTKYEAQNADDFKIVGLLNTTDLSINAGGVFMSLAAADDFLDLEGLRTELGVRMEKRVNLADAMADSDELAAAIKKDFPALEAQSFGEIGRSFLELSKAKSKGTGMIIVIIMLIAGVGIANTILMSVYSRVREIGVLRAFGFSPKMIRRLFLIEGGIIGFVGSIAGVLFGIGLDAYLILVGYPIDKMMGDIDLGLPIAGTLFGEWNPDQMLVAALIGILISLFASRSPAKKAAKLEVTNALRFV